MNMMVESVLSITYSGK